MAETTYSNPEVFASYGFDWGEVSIITKAERDAYTDMTLMRITGDPKIYRLVNGAISHISIRKHSILTVIVGTMLWK